jgi:hypothetical protein
MIYLVAEGYLFKEALNVNTLVPLYSAEGVTVMVQIWIELQT